MLPEAIRFVAGLPVGSCETVARLLQELPQSYNASPLPDPRPPPAAILRSPVPLFDTYMRRIMPGEDCRIA